MTRDEILGEWCMDSQLDHGHLDHDSLAVPKLHGKYWGYLSNEKMALRCMEADLKRLSFEKYEFYTQGETVASRDKGWELPPQGRVLRNEVERFLFADNDLLKFQLRVENQKQKVAVLEDIIKSLNNRHWVIRNAIEFQKFQAGG
jgi:hypothetical protein